MPYQSAAALRVAMEARPFNESNNKTTTDPAL